MLYRNRLSGLCHNLSHSQQPHFHLFVPYIILKLLLINTIELWMPSKIKINQTNLMPQLFNKYTVQLPSVTFSWFVVNRSSAFISSLISTVIRCWWSPVISCWWWSPLHFSESDTALWAVWSTSFMELARNCSCIISFDSTGIRSSTVWTALCRTRSSHHRNNPEQWLQLNVRSAVRWSNRCRFNDVGQVNKPSQSLHLNRTSRMQLGICLHGMPIVTALSHPSIILKTNRWKFSTVVNLVLERKYFTKVFLTNTSTASHPLTHIAVG